MPRDDDLLALEREFWTGDADFYRRHLSDHAVMVFPEPAGVLTREQVLEAIASGPRWAEVQMEEPRVVSLTSETAILTYKATARREGDTNPYVALVSSVYVNGDGRWKLAFHQHTVGALSP
jgi:Domain of unknown function (DUF4440)